MKRIFILLFTLLFTVLSLCSCGDNAETQTPSEVVLTPELCDSFASRWEERFLEQGFRGAAYVVYGGEEVYAGGAGKADKEAGTDNGPDVVYRIASISKQFTAAAILKLCEDGKLFLTDTLSLYFPDYEIGAALTIDSLLSMQSGIPDYVRTYDELGYETEISAVITIDGVEEENTAEENRKGVHDYICAQPLLFEQGERFSYSNSNYFLLAEIVEQVTGMSCHDYIRENFFEPLGMDTAGFIGDYDVKGATVAHGYNDIGCAELLSYDGAGYGAADIMASPKDLYKWTSALHGGKVLTDEMYRKMTGPQSKSKDGYTYGYGLMIESYHDDPIYYHLGSLPRFFSAVFYEPKYDYFIALTSNAYSESTPYLARLISLDFLTEMGLISDDTAG